MLWKFAKKFQFAADKIIPDSFVFCIILTLIVFVLGLILTTAGPLDMVLHWYGGLWSMIAFAFQMSFMVICCGAAAKAPQIKRLLTRLAKIPKSPSIAMVILLIFGFASSLINWAFSLIITPILAMQLSKNVRGLHFPLMIAAGYSAMILGQCWCPSASVYALLASEGHFMEDTLGIMTQAVTTYNPVNTVLWFILVGFTILICAFLTKPSPEEIVEYKGDYVDESAVVEEENGEKTIADKMNSSKFLMIIIGIAGVVYIIHSFATKGFIPSLNFNFVIFIFLTLNTFLYNTPEKFVTAIRESMKPATQVMLQFPFYGGIMGMMSGSGLTSILADALVKVATVKTFPFFSYFSASIVNLFVPSQGGQWIVQGPILVEAAQKIGADLPVVINAFVYGDEATNLIQPLYVIPALSLVDMKLKDVWGFMAFIWFGWFIVTSIGLLILPGLL
ncbi:MAG: short-chain fatty acid transporter [Firmicutes bacterium]|jgi:short-chain fatty acids transporter|nr:short-chain fatty acid transporter [Bacillota bacterium]